MAREFSASRIAPHALQWDRDHGLPRELVSEMAELGLLGMTFPEEFGGANVDMVSYVLAVMEISRGCSSVAVMMGVNHLVCEVVYKYGSDSQKSKYLKHLASGKGIGAFCLSEPQAGSDAQNQKTRATKGGNSFKISGKKAFITNGKYADVFIVTALTSVDPKEISVFVVERDTEGLIIGGLEEKMGQRASDTVEVTLDGVMVPEENLIGGVNGFKAMLGGLNSGRIGVAALCCGISQSALDLAVEYAKEREAFGGTLADLQAIQFKLADMAVGLETSRLLTLKAAYLKDENKNFISAASMAKLYASETCNRIVSEALQIHGGNGYIQEYLIEKLYRDARVTTIYEGTTEIQKLVIARQVLKGK